MARAVKRLYEIHGINGAGKPHGSNCATVAQLAGQIGKSEVTVKRLRTRAFSKMGGRVLPVE
jgi:hypothetical protein